MAATPLTPRPLDREKRSAPPMHEVRRLLARYRRLASKPPSRVSRTRSTSRT
jgi:hypothetical protein